MARARRSNLGFGVMLVVVGGVLMVTRFALMDTAPAWLLGLGVGLALLAIVGSSYGALVGGMILLGLGSGMLLGDRGVGGLSNGAWILLGLGAGFIGIWLLALLLSSAATGGLWCRESSCWPLGVPATTGTSP